MSRFTFETKGAEIAYGYDRVCGYFIQVFENDKLVIDKDCVNASRGQVIDLWDTYNVEGNNPEHMQLIALDLPIE